MCRPSHHQLDRWFHCFLMDFWIMKRRFVWWTFFVVWCKQSSPSCWRTQQSFISLRVISPFNLTGAKQCLFVWLMLRSTCSICYCETQSQKPNLCYLFTWNKRNRSIWLVNYSDTTNLKQPRWSVNKRQVMFLFSMRISVFTWFTRLSFSASFLVHEFGQH